MAAMPGAASCTARRARPTPTRGAARSREDDPPGVHLGAYSLSKIAGEAVVRYAAGQVRQPAHHHPDLLHLRTRGRHAGEPSAPHPRRQGDRPAPRRAQQLQPDLRRRLRPPGRSARSRWPRPTPSSSTSRGARRSAPRTTAPTWASWWAARCSSVTTPTPLADLARRDPHARGPGPDPGAVARGHAPGRRDGSADRGRAAPPPLSSRPHGTLRPDTL